VNEWETLLEHPKGDRGELTEKQKNIIQAAIEIFAEKGFSASSTSEIARKAGVAEGTIFRHYKTKKDLLIAIIEPVIRNLLAPFIVQDLDKVLDQRYNNFEEFLRAMEVNRKHFLEKNLSLFKILIQEIPFHPELKELFKRYVTPEPLAKLDALIKHFQAKGEIIQLPTYTIVRLVGTSIIGYLFVRNIIPSDVPWDDEEEREQTFQFILRGLKVHQVNQK